MERINDLKLAASFVKSIETEDHGVNLEIQRLAGQIEEIAEQLSGRTAMLGHAENVARLDDRS